MRIKITPFDTVFFRDGKPFTMGSDTWANGVFPPYPSVLYGALRSLYFSHNIDKLDTANTENDPTANLVIKGLGLEMNGILYYPVPLDLVKENGSLKAELYRLKTVEKPIFSNCPTEKISIDTENRNIKPVTEGYMDISAINNYLNLIPSDFHYVPLNNFSVIEPKTGIGIEKKTNKAEDTKLYRVGMNRLQKNVSINVDFEGIDIAETGLSKVGGEGRPVYYSKSSTVSETISITKPVINCQYFKLYLVTPAIFGKGWIPTWINEDNLEGVIKKMRLKLITACIGKPLFIGGFDIKAKKPKPMRKAVPAGSIYIFKIIDGDIQEAINLFHGNAISDGQNERKQGFGITYIGGV